MTRAASPRYGWRVPPSDATQDDALPEVMVNDNRQPAGTRSGGSLVLNLRAGVGRWHPEGGQGTALTVESFGEESGPLQVPAPLIRVVDSRTTCLPAANRCGSTSGRRAAAGKCRVVSRSNDRLASTGWGRST
jgi:hypothetical protein